jgi:3-methyl-2-oxobutanoate hydroxymethyltransferase
MNKHNIRTLQKMKNGDKTIQMLTCYDYQMATLLNETNLDLILVGDSVGNVILGHETTVETTMAEMLIFSKAVTKGATNKFVVVDMPFGTYINLNDGIKNAIHLFQDSKAQAIKIEGAHETHLELVTELTNNGIPVMGHIGLRPQSVHQQGGYFVHGKTEKESDSLRRQAYALQKAGAFAIVLECINEDTATDITNKLTIPTIGIGSGNKTDGQVLVINDLFKMGKDSVPNFVNPISNFYEMKKELIANYLGQDNERNNNH